MTQTEEKKSQGSRRAGRRIAFQILYGLGYVPAEPEESFNNLVVKSPAVFDTDTGGLTENAETRAFGAELLQGVSQHQKDIDAVIASLSKHWKFDRIARVELAILRISVYELLYRNDIPVSVSINEAIELSKKYCDEKSRPFINGILDAAAKGIENGEITAIKDL